MSRRQIIIIASLAVLAVVFVAVRQAIEDPDIFDHPIVARVATYVGKAVTPETPPPPPPPEPPAPAAPPEPPAPAAPSVAGETVEPAPPPPVDLSPEEARRLAAERLVIGGVEGAKPAPRLARGQGYATVDVTVASNDGLADFFLAFFARDVGTVAVTAVPFLDDGRRFSPVAIVVLTRTGGDGTFVPAAPADGRPIVPRFRLDDASVLSVVLDVAYATDRDPAFADGIPEGRRSKTLAGLIRATVPLAHAAHPPAVGLALHDAEGTTVGSIAFRAAVRRSLLDAHASDYRHLMAADMGGSQTLGDRLREREDLVAGVLAAPPERLADACMALHTELTGPLALSAFDAATVLDVLARTRARTAADPGECLDSSLAAVLGGSGPASAGAAGETPSRTAVGPLNRALDRMATGLRNGAPETARDSLAGLFADRAVLVDRGGIWLGGADAPIVYGSGVAVDPSAGPKRAADHLLGLPVAHFACYSSAGSGRRSHRAALVQLSNDPALWVLEAAFEAGGKISGIAFSPAAQPDACRATAGRTGGVAPCFFAAAGRRFRDIDFARCP